MMNFNLLAVIVIVVSMATSTNVVAEGQCHYTSSTTTENGVIISKKEIKVCDETTHLGKQSFLTKEEKMQMFETGLILTFIFILENM